MLIDLLIPIKSILQMLTCPFLYVHTHIHTSSCGTLSMSETISLVVKTKKI